MLYVVESKYNRVRKANKDLLYILYCYYYYYYELNTNKPWSIQGVCHQHTLIDPRAYHHYTQKAPMDTSLSTTEITTSLRCVCVYYKQPLAVTDISVAASEPPWSSAPSQHSSSSPSLHATHTQQNK